MSALKQSPQISKRTIDIVSRSQERRLSNVHERLHDESLLKVDKIEKIKEDYYKNFSI